MTWHPMGMNQHVNVTLEITHMMLITLCWKWYEVYRHIQKSDKVLLVCFVSFFFLITLIGVMKGNKGGQQIIISVFLLLFTWHVY